MKWSSFDDYLERCAHPQEPPQTAADPPVVDLASALAASPAGFPREAAPDDISAEPLPLFGCMQRAGCGEPCVSACPTGANIALEYGAKSREILHLDEKCLHCGKCAQVCPFKGHPARDKFTLYAAEEAYGSSRTSGFLPVGGDRYIVRYGSKQKGFQLGMRETAVPLEIAALVSAAAKQLGV